MASVSYQTGKFATEEVAVSETVNCALLSFPREWLDVNGSIGTNILPKVWRSQLDGIEEEAQAALQPFADWFVMVDLFVRPIDGSFIIEVHVQLVESGAIIVVSL